MTFLPPRRQGLLLGALFLALLLGAVGFAADRLAQAEISAWILLWVALPLACIPGAALVAYRLHGLLTASYHLDRQGFTLRWGLALEQIPIEALAAPRHAEQVAPGLRPAPGLWWPGCLVGARTVEGLGRLEFFATQPGSLVIVSAGDRHLAISPPDPQAFLQAFGDAVRMVSLEPLPARAQRPDFLFERVWGDRLARALIVAGLAVWMLLLAYLAIRAPGLPSDVPIRFDAAGNPAPIGAPGRLLLLPFIGGLCWLADLLGGAWLFRREADARAAYVLWAASLAVGLLLWGAALQLIAAAYTLPAPGL